MFGFGMPELVLLAMIIVAVGSRFAGGMGMQTFGPTLVLRKFFLADTASTGPIVDITGRASGVMAWVLTAIGLDAETSLRVTEKDVTFRSSSLFRQIYQVVPLPSVSSTHCGYIRPIAYLVLGGLALVGSIVSMLNGTASGGSTVVGIGIGAGLLAAYSLSKKIVISLETTGGMVMGLSFKRSVIENVSVDIDEALRAIRIVNEKAVESHFGPVSREFEEREVVFGRG